MQEKEKAPERERRDWIIFVIILLLGFLCVILAGGQALRFSPDWKRNTSMDSHINPDSVFLDSHPSNLLEPLDPSILTPPAWFDTFLTPGAVFNTRTPAPPTLKPTSTVPNTPLPTNTTVPTVTARPTNTFIIIPNPTKTSPPPPDTDTPVPQPEADLSVTITDDSTDYVANQYKLLPNVFPYAYKITISNAGPSNVSGATVSNAFTDGTSGTTVNVVPSSVGWICVPSAGGTCPTPSFGTGNLNNAAVNLNSGFSVTFYLAAQVVNNPIGPLINTATVTAPAGVSDPPGNNSATDTDQLVVVDPNGNIGSTPDDSPAIIPAGTYVTLQFSTPLEVVGVGNYLVYYERRAGSNPGILMDAVILQVGDGSNWYTILNWGNGSPDTNTNISIPLSSNPTGDCTGEPDNCEIDASLLYTSAGYSTGITINVDGVVPNGTYPYIRIFSPPNPPDTDGMVEVDAIEILP